MLLDTALVRFLRPIHWLGSHNVQDMAALPNIWEAGSVGATPPSCLAVAAPS